MNPKRNSVLATSCWLLLASVSRLAAQESEDILDTSTWRPVVVNLPELGRVQGKRQAGIDFFGALPYAAPPVGNRRFAPPEPPAPWSPATLDATAFGPDCWQTVDPLLNPVADVELMSEDCLQLNVFSPAGQSSRSHSPLPVLVWLHGGAFRQGGARRAEYDGRRLAERGVVVVTLNYRLGALGFLVSSSDGVFGNFGLMDQRAALHWVHDNIKHFGGDPKNVMLFGESAGAVMTVLHLMMDGAGTLFHKAAIQSNPLGLQFRSVVVADFIGEALKHSIDCRDLPCLRAERVEEIMRAQSSLMGVPRSVGDFFTWGPTLSEELKLTVGSRLLGSSSPLSREHVMFRNLDSWRWQANRDASWSAVNVTQPLRNLKLIPDDIPLIIGSNRHEGEMFVHSAFPISMSKPVYWMFVGALFRDSASRVLKHYRGYVDELESDAKKLANKRVDEEKNRQYYLEHQRELDEEYERLLALNASKPGESGRSKVMEGLLDSWVRGGALLPNDMPDDVSWRDWLVPFRNNTREALIERARQRRERRIKKMKESALKEAAKISVDYRPVMSRIMNDYLFRCPAWHFAHSLSRNRYYRGKKNNIFVYQFSHSTHIPGYPECWGKACHTAELPFVFEAMQIIRSNYSTLGPYAQDEAPEAPEYPYTAILQAYRVALEAADREEVLIDHTFDGTTNSSYSIDFQRLLKTFFGDYFKEDADEEIARDMAHRWVSFAKTGDPNYGGSKANWRPWRYVFDDDDAPGKNLPWDTADFDRIFDMDHGGIEEFSDRHLGNETFRWSEVPEDLALRRRALNAMGMDVVEEDVFQTMLSRRPKNDDEGDNPLAFLFRNSATKSQTHTKNHEEKLERKAIRQLQQIAQDMGLLGSGLKGETRKGQHAHWEEDFFPEMLELKWPPEGRLVERDCTCDMWDRIRYRY